MRFFLFLTLSLSISQATFAAQNFHQEKAKSGGDLTVFNKAQDAFAKPAPSLDVEELRKFTFGNKLFNTNWTIAPASVTSLDGLGPLFNRNSCSGCHTKDGRGKPYAADEEAKFADHSILFRLSVIDKNGEEVPHPNYGGQLNGQGIAGIDGEGKVRIKYQKIVGRFKDGKKFELQKPIYEFYDLNYGEIGEFLFSPRVAPAVFGLGLLEAIDEKEILKFVDEFDADGDGISGRANYVFDQIKKRKSLGRFGWKSNQPSLAQQDAGAALGDIGLTSNLNSKENCGANQVACKNQPNGGKPEISNHQLDAMNFYISTLGVPARRNLDDEDVIFGEEIFAKIGCDSCHRMKIKTGNHHRIKQLRNQEIQPFTDLLLHDMGEDLADGRKDGLANGREWRTTPLWGIGLVQVVNGHTNFLHDGRARNIEEAILWHDGEGLAAKERFVALKKRERERLVRFLESL